MVRPQHVTNVDTFNVKGEGVGMKVDITTDVNGSVIAVKPSNGFTGTNYQYGDVVSISPNWYRQ